MAASSRSSWIKIAGLCGIVAPILTLVLIAAAISLYPPFNWTTNALSDLGVQEQSAVYFNSSLIIGGILTLLFAFGIKKMLWKNGLGKIATVVFIFAALSMISIGVFPESYGRLHYYVSVAFFISLPMAQFTVGATLIQNTKILGVFSLLTALAGFLVWVFPWEGAAIPEITASSAAAAWSIALGAKLVWCENQPR